MTTPDIAEARRLAEQLKERFGATVPTSQAAAMLHALAAEVERLRAQVAPAEALLNAATLDWPSSPATRRKVLEAADTLRRSLVATAAGNVATPEQTSGSSAAAPVAGQSLTVGDRECFEAWARGFSTLSLERDSHGHYVSMEQELLWLGFQAGKGKAPVGASLGESNADAGLGLAGPDSACSHEFVLQPSSSIHLCAKCGISEVAARAALAPAAQAEPVAKPALPEALGQWLTAIGELYLAMGRPKFEATEPTLGVVETLREAARRLANPPAQGTGELPPLPEPAEHGDIDNYYTADQMHAYARAALAQSPAAQTGA